MVGWTRDGPYYQHGSTAADRAARVRHWKAKGHQTKMSSAITHKGTQFEQKEYFILHKPKAKK